MQPDSIDELRAGIDQRDGGIGAHPQTVGRECSSVAATDDDDVVEGSCLGHALKTPRIAET
jgi:hypothetical protein